VPTGAGAAPAAGAPGVDAAACAAGADAVADGAPSAALVAQPVTGIDAAIAASAKTPKDPAELETNP